MEHLSQLGISGTWNLVEHEGEQIDIPTSFPLLPKCLSEEFLNLMNQL